MQVNKIEIQNYRCFDDYTIELGKHATVLIGNNGVGKSNLIKALKQGLTFVFGKKTKGGSNPINEHGYHPESFDYFDSRFDVKKDMFNYPIQLKFYGTINENPLRWTFKKEKANGGLFSSLYQDALNIFIKEIELEDDQHQLPVFAYYSDSYPHAKANIGTSAKRLTSKESIPWTFGYYMWEKESNCADLWINRYIRSYNTINDYKGNTFKLKSELVEKQQQLYNDLIGNETTANKSQNELKRDIEIIRAKISELEKDKVEAQEIRYIDSILKTFTDSIEGEYNDRSDFKIKEIGVERPADIKDHELYLKFDSGKKTYFKSLPTGYKRLFSIVLDLAYRSFILNRENAPLGVVIIDEIGLHLHPSLQQSILKRFTSTFPQLQFVVTTHSPLVISNFYADGCDNKIIRLMNNGDEYSNELVPNPYGLDYATNLNEIMDTSPRSSTIDKYVSAYLFLFGKKRLEDANKVLDKLKTYMGGQIPRLLQSEIEEQKAAYKK